MPAKQTNRTLGVLRRTAREPGYYIKIGKGWHRVSTQSEADAARVLMTLAGMERATMYIWTGSRWKHYGFQFTRTPVYRV